MKIAVTGAAGFIGAHAVRAALLAGHEVLAVARTADPWRLRGIPQPFERVEGDFGSAEVRAQVIRWEPDACIHLAWFAEPSTYLHSPRNVESLVSSLAWIEALLAGGCRRLVVAGTCAEYDTDRGYLREDGPARPATIYAAAKFSLNTMSRHLSEQAGATCAWGRIFFPYGPMEDERRVLPALTQSLLKEERFAATRGEQVRDYIHVEDTAAAFLKLAESASHGIFNICSGSPVTLRHAMETVGDITGRGGLIDFGAVDYRRDELMFVCGDNRRLRDSTGWQPRFRTLTDGLSQTVAWWQHRLRGEAA